MWRVYFESSVPGFWIFLNQRLMTTAFEVVGSGGGSGRTLSDLFQNSKRLLLKSRDGLEGLERLEYSSSSLPSSSLDSSPELFNNVKRDISQIRSLCADMDHLWRSIPAKPQRDLWKRKVEQVAEEAESLKDSLDKYSQRHQRRVQGAQERAELLGQANGESSHVLRIFDEEAQAMQSVQNSSRMLEDAYATGVAILSKYSEQRDHLKRAQRKALDALNRLGLSNSVLRLIERRNRVDKWIKYAGNRKAGCPLYMDRFAVQNFNEAVGRVRFKIFVNGSGTRSMNTPSCNFYDVYIEHLQWKQPAIDF